MKWVFHRILMNDLFLNCIYFKNVHMLLSTYHFLKKIIYKICIILFHLNTFFVKYISIVLTEMEMTKLFRLSIHVWRLLSFSDCYCFNTMPKGYIVHICKCEQFYAIYLQLNASNVFTPLILCKRCRAMHVNIYH